MAKKTDSSANNRSGIATDNRSYTYYENFSDPFVKAIDVNTTWDTTKIVNDSDSLNLTSAMNNRTSKGIPVVLNDKYDPETYTGNVTLDYQIADIVPRSSTDIGFYKDRTTGKKILTKYKYVNREIWIPGTDGKPIYYQGYYVPVGPPPPKADTSNSDSKTEITDSTKGYLWNLPPHRWSMPFNASKSGMITPGGTRPGSVDRYRRGRIWSAYKANTYTVDASGKKNWSKDNLGGNGYGFQFLWNPENLTTNVSVTMDATPNQNDQWLGAAGLFPATEQFGITVRLDRTNDFARAGAKFGRPTKVSKGDGPKSNDFITEAQVIDLLKEYQVKDAFEVPESVRISNLKDLFQRGTLGDLEYLFMAINGKGPSPSSNWVNPRGIETANIGWLQPNLVHIDVGPLSYLGWVTSLTVTHTMFTQDMIPVRSDVQMSFNTLATAGIGSAFADTNRQGPGPAAPNTSDGKPNKIPNYSAWDART